MMEGKLIWRQEIWRQEISRHEKGRIEIWPNIDPILNPIGPDTSGLIEVDLVEETKSGGHWGGQARDCPYK